MKVLFHSLIQYILKYLPDRKLKSILASNAELMRAYHCLWCIYSLLCRISNKNRCGRGLIVSVWNWLDGCGLLLA